MVDVHVQLKLHVYAPMLISREYHTTVMVVTVKELRELHTHC